MPDSLRCFVCSTVLPDAAPVIGKTLGTALASVAGLAKTKSAGGAVVVGLLGFVAGHVVDLIIARIKPLVCGNCGQAQST